ncbi:neuronal acetylcholine receptor subunit alpha-7-like isoform X2 [Varroa destructor]|uniref:Neurotransmitter-gated ion-channel ligand-binding domain-containing protein n=1 Tax=Varroa destructor TaxID=109461 RepID=A0A7M7KNB0_VARDE|nr:neuronal acetylcholine receptor subunit alpha-7-like isoform X2 [Varroa destructor]
MNIKPTKAHIGGLVTVALMTTGFYPLSATGSPHERQLAVDLLQYYNIVERPTRNLSQPVIVRVNVNIQKIMKLDPNAGELTTRIWLSLHWEDANLVWDPLRYNNVSAIRLQSSRIWQPDVRFYNGISEQIEPTQAIVFSSGKVKLISPITVKTRCGGPIEGLGRWFPFDQYSCSLIIGTWTSYSGSVDLHWQEENGGTVRFNDQVADDTGEWQLLGNHKGRAEVQFACCSETHTSMTVQLRLQRRAFSYVFSHYLPLLWMLALASSTLLIPNDRTDLRLIAGTLLMMGVFWWPSGQHLPFNVISIGHLFTGLIILGVSSCFVSHCVQLVLISSSIDTTRRQTPLAEYLNRLLTTSTALKLALISDNRPEHDKDGLPDCSRVLDRLSLLLLAVIACLALVICLILPCMVA